MTAIGKQRKLFLKSYTLKACLFIIISVEAEGIFGGKEEKIIKVNDNILLLSYQLTLSWYIVMVIVVNVFVVARDQCYCCTIWDLMKNNKHTDYRTA